MTKVLTCVYSLYTKDDTFLHDPISDVVCVRYESVDCENPQRLTSEPGKIPPLVPQK